MSGFSTIPGSPESRRQIRWLGVAIGALWIVAFIAQLFVPAARISPLSLSARGGNAFVQLATYSFFHWSLLYLVEDLVWLAGVVWLARQRASAEVFVRLYSVGTIGGGGLWLLVAWIMSRIEGGRLFSTDYAVGGGAIALVTMIGALAALPGDQSTFFLGPDGARISRERIGTILLALGILYVLSDAAVNRIFNPQIAWTPLSFLGSLTLRSLFDRLYDVGDIAATFYVIRNRLPVSRIAPTLVAPFIVLSFAHAVLGEGRSAVMNPFFYAYATGLILGTAYAVVERFFTHHARPA